MPIRSTTTLAALLTMCTLGCGDAAVESPNHFGADPIALDEQLVFVDATNRTAFLLDVSAPQPKAASQRIALPPNASVAVRRSGSDHNEALVLCAGLRGTTDRDAEPSALVAIGTDATSHTYELGTTPFNALTQSADGRYAIAYRSDQADKRTLDNPNELVVVDLDLRPDDPHAVTRKTPDGLAHTLSSVLVSPTLRIAGEDRRLLVVLSAAEVTLLDLGHLERRATIVSLDETRLINPTQVVFSKANPTLYVRAASSDNIFMFRFEAYENDALGNDFRPTINPISGGAGPRDMALFGEGAAERLLVVAQNSAQVLVIDPSSSKTTALTLKAAAQHILLFDGPSPNDPQTRTRALLYSDTSTVLTFFDAESLGDNPADSLESVVVTAEANRLIPLLDDGQVVLMQAASVTLVDLEQRTLTPIAAGAPLTGAVFDSERKRLWVGASGDPYVGSLDLTTGMTGEVRLDANIQKVVPMFQHQRLAIVHDSQIGHVTLLDLTNPDREHAVVLRGFLIDGALDRGER